MVVAYDPEPEDVAVQIVWHGPDQSDDRRLKAFEGPPWPIEKYDECVAWAKSMADFMRAPIHVVPLRKKDLRRMGREA